MNIIERIIQEKSDVYFNATLLFCLIFVQAMRFETLNNLALFPSIGWILRDTII